MIKKLFQNKQLMLELFRFVIVGGVATIVDYLISYFSLNFIFKELGSFQIIGIVVNIPVVLSTTLGFSISLIINYLLSLFFVFKTDVDKAKSRSFIGFIKFVVLAIGGLIINIIIKSIGDIISPTEGNLLWFTVVFIIATGVVLVYNYLTRKFFIFNKNKADRGKNIDETIN